MLVKKASYERPTVETLRANRIVEAMGPVSCGSGMQLPVDDGIGGSTRATQGPSGLAR